MLRLRQRGDTIVEVMIALSVIGLTIATGYSIATRSLNGVRVSHERSEATKIAEGQIEQVKYFVENDRMVVDSATGPFCFDGLGGRVDDVTDPLCTKDSLYNVSIEQSTQSLTCYLDTGTGSKDFVQYEVLVGWERAGGGEPQTLSMYYREPTKDPC